MSKTFQIGHIRSTWRGSSPSSRGANISSVAHRWRNRSPSRVNTFRTGLCKAPSEGGTRVAPAPQGCVGALGQRAPAAVIWCEKGPPHDRSRLPCPCATRPRSLSRPGGYLPGSRRGSDPTGRAGRGPSRAALLRDYRQPSAHRQRGEPGVGSPVAAGRCSEIPFRWLPAGLLTINLRIVICLLTCAPGRIRTRELLPRRHTCTVA